MRVSEPDGSLVIYACLAAICGDVRATPARFRVVARRSMNNHLIMYRGIAALQWQHRDAIIRSKFDTENMGGIATRSVQRSVRALDSGGAVRR
jgi:hypothetical protein